MIAQTLMISPIRKSLLPAVDETESGSLLAAIVAVGGAGLIALMVVGGMPQVIACFVTLVYLGILVLLSPQIAIMATLVFLAVMGDFRRLVLHDGSHGNDPILLVGPIIALALFGIAIAQGRISRTHSKLAKLVAALMVIMVLQIFNPLQGGILVGVGGALFYLVPVLWFWIGQSWGTALFTERVLFRIAVPVAFVAALFGLRQVFVGLYQFEHAWVLEQYGNAPVLMGSNLRPFAFFVSTAEYPCYLALAIVMLIASAIAGTFRLSLLALPLMCFALFMSGCRGPIVNVLTAVVFLWAIRSRTIASAAVSAVLAAVLVVVGMSWALSEAKELQPTADAGRLVNHQIDGLTSSPDKSTAGGHAQLIGVGFTAGLMHPLGSGLGSTTLAAGKFGGSGASTEVDYSDMFVSTGAVGGILYLLIIFQVLKTSVMLYRSRRTALGLVIAGFLICGNGRWLLGGCYAQVALTWFCIGGLDRIASKTSAAELNPLDSARRKFSINQFQVAPRFARESI